MIAPITQLGDLAQTAGVVVAALLAAAALLARSDRARSARDARRARPDAGPARREHLVDAAAASAARPPDARARGCRAWGSSLLALGAVAIHRKPELVALARGGRAAVPRADRVRRRHREPAAAAVLRDRRRRAGVRGPAAARDARASTTDEDEAAAASGRRARGCSSGCSPASVVLYAVQSAYSPDFDRALSQVIFFYVPFALLFALLVRIEWTPRLLGRCLVVLLALAVAFVGIGFVEYARRELLLNPKVISSNQLESYFRVNSLFFDPNIYGRFLATVMIGITAVLLWSRRTALVAGCACALVLLWAGLVLTLSQSSFTALLAGLAVLGGLRWGARRAALAVARVRRRGRGGRARRAGRDRRGPVDERGHKRALEPRLGRSRCSRATGRSWVGARGRFATSTAGTRRRPTRGRRRRRTRSRSRSPPSRASGGSRCTSRCSSSRSAGCCGARARRSRARRSPRRSWRSSCTRCSTRPSSRTR